LIFLTFVIFLPRTTRTEEERRKPRSFTESGCLSEASRRSTEGKRED